MTFINKDSGAEYEEVSKRPDDYDQIVIRPVKKPKKEFWSLWWQPDGVDLPALFSERITQDQAQLIKEAVELSMDWLNRRPDHVFPESSWNKVKDAMKGDND